MKAGDKITQNKERPVRPKKTHVQGYDQVMSSYPFSSFSNSHMASEKLDQR
jgi:hypothetical protein